MILRAFRYELKLLKARWWLFLIVVLAIIFVLTLLAIGPISGSENGLLSALRNSDGTFQYPGMSNHESVLVEYQQRYDAILLSIASGTRSAKDAEGELMLLSFFLGHGTTEYECLSYSSLFQAREGMISLACGLNILEGGSLITVVLSSGLGAYLFGKPIRKLKMRAMIEAGCDRKSLFWGKICFALALLATYLLILTIFGLILVGPFFQENVLQAIQNGYSYVPIWSMFTGRILGLVVSGLFYLFFSSLIGLVFRQEIVSFSAPIILSAFFFIISNVTAPSFRNYGQLSGIGGMLLVCLPFSNIVIEPSFGLLSETYWVLVIYAMVSLILGFLVHWRLRRMAL